MEKNILDNLNISKVLLIYNDAGGKRRREVHLGYYDEQNCFFTLNINLNFLPPDLHSAAELQVFSPNGIHKAHIKIKKIEQRPTVITFEIATPHSWELVQRRKFIRTQIKLPAKIKYEDGFEIVTETNDISAGGFACFYSGAFSGIYQKLTADIEIKFPEDAILYSSDNTLRVKANCVRVQEDIPDHFGEKLIAFEFQNLDYEILDRVRRFICMHEN